MSTCLCLGLFGRSPGVRVGTMGPVYQQTELQLAHGAGPSCLGSRMLRVLGQAEKLVRQDLSCLSGRGRRGNSVGLGMVPEHPTTSHGNEMKTRGRAVTLKPKGRSTFPESLSCDGLPSTAKAARTLMGLAGRSPKGRDALSRSHGAVPWERALLGVGAHVGRDTSVLFFCRFRTTGELHLWSLEHGGEPQLWATDTAR